MVSVLQTRSEHCVVLCVRVDKACRGHVAELEESLRDLICSKRRLGAMEPISCQKKRRKNSGSKWPFSTSFLVMKYAQESVQKSCSNSL